MPSTTTTNTSKRLRFGILVPSSNTVLEPLTQEIISQLPGVTVHFSRFRVLKISLSTDGLAQFNNHAPIIEAAQLLSDAKCDIIGWSGTSGGWLGFEEDVKLCEEITAATGIPATTSVLGLNKLIKKLEISNLALLTPYTDDVQAAIIANFQKIGVQCKIETHLGLSDNAIFGGVPTETIDEAMHELVGKGAKSVSVFCTGLKAAQMVEVWEKKFGIVVLDTVATVIWDMCVMIGVDVRQIEGWGMLFREGV
jgi:maleate isomerase